MTIQNKKLEKRISELEKRLKTSEIILKDKWWIDWNYVNQGKRKCLHCREIITTGMFYMEIKHNKHKAALCETCLIDVLRHFYDRRNAWGLTENKPKSSWFTQDLVKLKITATQ